MTIPFLASLKAASDAASLGLNTHIVRDAGRTQIAPGSKTVLCVGPGKSKCTEKIVTYDSDLSRITLTVNRVC